MADNPWALKTTGAGSSGNPWDLGAQPVAAKKKGGGFFGSVKRYSGVELAGNLASDVGNTALGVVPGIVSLGGMELSAARKSGGNPADFLYDFIKPVAAQTGEQYKRNYYRSDVLSHLYAHPLQPVLDALTVATLGAGAGVRAGLVSGERASLVTRSPVAAVTGEGPTLTDLSSTAPLVRAREVAATKARAARPEGTLGIGGEFKRYGKGIQAQATRDAMERLIAFEPYAKATRKLSPDEWTALHIRAMDIHPVDLAELWKGTPDEKFLTPKVAALVEAPSPRMVVAEPEARLLSDEGAILLKQQGRLGEEAAAARPDLTKRQASEVLGRPVREIHGDPYYFPHTLEPQPSVSPLAPTGGGRGVPRVPGTTKQNLGVLALRGKLHLRGDVLGPEFLRRVKYVKYDEIHKALLRGSPSYTIEQIDQLFGGKLPKGWEYVRANAGQNVPATIRGEGDRVRLDQMVPNPEDLHNSPLGEGFGTEDRNLAHEEGGRYFIAPSSTIQAATGEFTRSSDFVRIFVKRPLAVWRAIVLGLRVGFLTNNLVGNSLMYAVKTGGQGAVRDLFGAIYETHGPKVAKQALDSAATPPRIRADLYKEFFPEQVRGTFGRTQSPATSPGHIAGQKAVEAGRTVTGAIPKLTSRVAEEMPRRALIRHYIRHSPEFKKVYGSLPKQTRTFEEAARKVLSGEGGPEYQRYISKRVNQALGDYLGLSAAERNVLRNILPFYSWYKAIVTTTFHLAVDTPLRANILGQIGQIGKQQNDESLGDVPSFLRGAIPVGQGKGDTKKVLGTQSLNPYATLEQLRRGAASDVTDLGLNPFLAAAATAFANKPSGGISPGKLTADTLYAMLRGLPPSRLIAPMPPSNLYPNRGRESEFYSFLGAPIKDYNPVEAKRQKESGR